MNSWESLRLDCKKMFGFKPAIWQIKLWWFGSGNSETKQKHIDHRNYVIHAVGPWDVVIKLAFRYTAKEIAKKNKRWKDKEIASYIYWLLWTPFRQFTTEKVKGKNVEMPTFWNFAVENSKRINPVISQRGTKKLREILKGMADKI